jgi:hypothetical protein
MQPRPLIFEICPPECQLLRSQRSQLLSLDEPLAPSSSDSSPRGPLWGFIGRVVLNFSVEVSPLFFGKLIWHCLLA